MAHDKKLNEAIALAIDLLAASKGKATVKEVRDTVQIKYPDRKWHPYDHREASNDYLSKQIIKVFKAPVSDSFLKAHPDLIKKPIRREHRLLLGNTPAWFFVRSEMAWVYSLTASADQWDEGETMRIDMAEAIVDVAVAFKERADIVRKEKVKHLLELITR